MKTTETQSRRTLERRKHCCWSELMWGGQIKRVCFRVATDIELLLSLLSSDVYMMFFLLKLYVCIYYGLCFFAFFLVCVCVLCSVCSFLCCLCLGIVSFFFWSIWTDCVVFVALEHIVPAMSSVRGSKSCSCRVQYSCFQIRTTKATLPRQ